MDLKKIRQILSIFLIVVLALGIIIFLSTKKIENKKENEITKTTEMKVDQESVIIKNDLITYLNHSRVEIEQALGEELIQFNRNGQVIDTNGIAQDFFLFFDENLVKAILISEENMNFQVDGMKVGDLVSEKQAYLKEEYDYKSYIFKEGKRDLYEKKDGNFSIMFDLKEKRIVAMLGYEKEFEDSLFKQIEFIRNTKRNGEFSGYVLEDSDKKYIELEQLEALTERELILAEKEIYARYGAVFDEENIQIVFNRTEWYLPKDVTEKEVEKQLNQYEKENINRIEKVLEEKADS